MKRITQKLLRMTTAVAITTAMVQAMPMAIPEASAASANWKFDFGNGGTESGYTGVTASTKYDASRGYGFSDGTTVKDVTAAGSGALSDAVQFTNSSSTGNYGFCADVPNGLYQVSVWLGNTNRTSIAAEGMYQIINMTGNNAYDTFQIPVTDGQLNICACAGKDGYAYTISALEITQISTDPTTNPTIWICGDSTVCNYYPLNSSTQAGWGQMLPSVLGSDSKWQIRNMAASGQYAAGFLNAGQFTAIETYGKAGDKYIISIGINDTNYSNAEEYYNVVTDMAKRAMAKGMEVILVKQQGRNGDASRNPLLTGRWFGTQLDQIGTELGLQVVDLFNLWQNYCIAIGETETTNLYMSGDTLHPNRAGATVLAELMAQAVDFSGTATAYEGVQFTEGSTYMIQNVNSGQFLTVEGGVAADNTNVCQSANAAPNEANQWKMMPSAQDGYYYLYSMLNGGNTYLLDVAAAGTGDGTNIGIFSNTNHDAQLFKISDNGDGTYRIHTKVTNDASVVGVTGNSTEDGANVIEWTIDNTANQNWRFIASTAATSDHVYLHGDMNGDGILNALDLSILKHSITAGFAKAAAQQAADLNSDDTISMADAVLLAKYLVTNVCNFSARKYYAMNGNINSGVLEQSNAGFTAASYVNLDNIVGSSLTMNVNVPQSGNYLCTFYIANGSEVDRKMMISVSGQSDTWLQNFLSTGAWTTWQERAIVLPLTAGINMITLVSNTAEGGPNIDFMRVELTDEPIAEPYTPTTEDTDNNPTVSDQPVVYIASDSTAQSYRESYAPQQGWGYYLGNYFSDNVTVDNRAIAGRSSKSFYDNGRLTSILDSMKAGDYLLIDFGINDGASSNAERYAPVCGNVDNPTEGSFEYYITFYIQGTLDKGGTPILMSPTLSIKNQQQPFTAGYRNIDTACRALAAKYNIPYFDLGQAMVDQFNSLPYDTVYNYYLGGATSGTDFTHLTEDGATATAKIIADGIKAMGIPLSDLVK